MLKKKKKTVAISQLDSADKIALILLLQEQNNLLKEKYQRLEKRFKVLEGRLAKNSSNSSRPPSSDMNKSNRKKKTPQRTTSSKKKTGKKPGGQPGHKGHYLKMSSTPDDIVFLPVVECGHCYNDLTRVKATLEKRQEFEIPEPKIEVIEYQAQEKYCNQCGYTTSACFPDRITHQTQYGPRAKSLLVYMNQYQLLPFERASEFFETVYGHTISPGTIVNAVNTLAHRLEQVEQSIKTCLTASSLVHCDETSVNITGNKQWLHTVGNERLTHCVFLPRGPRIPAEEDQSFLLKRTTYCGWTASRRVSDESVSLITQSSLSVKLFLSISACFLRRDSPVNSSLWAL